MPERSTRNQRQLMKGEEMRGEESLLNALVCDSPQPPRPSLLALARQADESLQRGRFEAILHLHCISVTHGSIGRSGRIMARGRSQRRSNQEMASALIRHLRFLIEMCVDFEEVLRGWKAKMESVGHSQTRPEPGRIFGMEVTQTSPQIHQIPRQTLLPKNLHESTPKTLIF